MKHNFLKKRMKTLFNLILVDLMADVKRLCNFIVPVDENQITANFLRIMTILTLEGENKPNSFLNRLSIESTVQLKVDELIQRFDKIF